MNKNTKSTPGKKPLTAKQIAIELARRQKLSGQTMEPVDNMGRIITTGKALQKMKKQVVLKSGKWPPDKPEIVRELTPELADKIWKAVEKKRYDDKVSQERVVHELNQIKAQLGKELAMIKRSEKSTLYTAGYKRATEKCMEIVDNKIKKVKGI